MKRLLLRARAFLTPTGPGSPVVKFGILAAVYLGAFLLLTPHLHVSTNYLILIPLLGAGSLFGFWGGTIMGFVALPLNWALFRLQGAVQYAPESLTVAWISGIVTGVIVGSLGSYYRKVEEEIQTRRKAQEELQAVVQEREVLVQEVHHRVKNNLAIIASLVNLQQNNVEDEELRQILRQTHQRVHSIYLIHEKLYNSPTVSRIDFAAYVRDLTDEIRNSSLGHPMDVAIEVEGNGIHLNVKNLIPLGLVLNELVTNSLKYAFVATERPRISIDLAREGEEYHLTVRDNGRGVPDDFKLTDQDGLGSRLVLALVGQIDGEVSVRGDGGMRVDIRFPVPTARKEGSPASVTSAKE